MILLKNGRYTCTAWSRISERFGGPSTEWGSKTRPTSKTARALAPASPAGDAFSASTSLVRAVEASARWDVYDDEGSWKTLEKVSNDVVGKGYKNGGIIDKAYSVEDGLQVRQASNGSGSWRCGQCCCSVPAVSVSDVTSRLEAFGSI